MIKAGTRVRDLYQHSETHVVVRQRKHERAANVRYWGSEAKADEWYKVRSDVSGNCVYMHRKMLAVANG